jgi:uncharacterized protein (TIGR02231 family)
MMRLTLTFAFAITLFVAQATEPIKVPSSLSDVTVFQSGAQITRSSNVNVPAGVSTLEFSGITEYMDVNTVQLTANKNLTLLSITATQDFLSPDNKSPKILDLEKKIRSNRYEMQKVLAQEAAYREEKQMIVANQKITDNKNINLEQLKQTTSYFGKRSLEINLALAQSEFDKEDLKKEQQKLNKQLQVEMQAFSKRTNKVVVQLLADKAVAASFKLSYIVQNASWISTYDARVDNLDKPVKLIHKAKITQQTGEDWENVNLKLATGNPSASAQIPFMSTWHVGIHSVQPEAYRKNAPATMNANVRGSRADAKEVYYDGVKAQSFNISQNVTQQEYSIERKQSIRAGATASTVILRSLELDAEYEYHAKPRIEKDVFLIAKVYNWESYDLLSGDLSLFNNNTYVGKAYLNTENPTDTLQLSLGRDKNVIVKRTRLIDKQEKTLFGSKRIDTYLWNIEVRNNKKSNIKLLLKDQVPVSKHEEVEVSIKNLNGGNLDAPTGIVKWQLSIKPGQTQTRQLGYEIKYPKAQRQNLRFF